MIVNALISLDPLETSSLHKRVVHAYFAKLNSGEFLAVAGLFLDEGYLHPPFDRLVRGQEAIAHYLGKEAQGMEFCPESIEEVVTDSRGTQYQVRGNVKTHGFTVQVAWLIDLNPVQQIISIEVKLLNPLNELLGLDRPSVSNAGGV